MASHDEISRKLSTMLGVVLIAGGIPALSKAAGQPKYTLLERDEMFERAASDPLHVPTQSATHRD